MKPMIILLAGLVAAAPLTAVFAQTAQTQAQLDAKRLAGDKNRALSAERNEKQNPADMKGDQARLAGDKNRALNAERNEKQTPADMKGDQARLAADKSAALKRNRHPS